MRSALIVDGWFFALEQDVLAEGTAQSGEEPQLIERTNALMEQRLAEITKQAPAFAATLRAYRPAWRRTTRQWRTVY